MFLLYLVISFISDTTMKQFPWGISRTFKFSEFVWLEFLNNSSFFYSVIVPIIFLHFTNSWVMKSSIKISSRLFWNQNSCMKLQILLFKYREIEKRFFSLWKEKRKKIWKILSNFAFWTKFLRRDTLGIMGDQL